MHTYKVKASESSDYWKITLVEYFITFKWRSSLLSLCNLLSLWYRALIFQVKRTVDNGTRVTWPLHSDVTIRIPSQHSLLVDTCNIGQNTKTYVMSLTIALGQIKQPFYSIFKPMHQIVLLWNIEDVILSMWCDILYIWADNPVPPGCCQGIRSQ